MKQPPSPESICRTLVVGPLPPPVTGASLITERVARALSQKVPIKRISTASAFKHKGLLYHGERLFRTLFGLVRALPVMARPNASLYMPSSAGWGLVYDSVFVAVAHLLKSRLIIHHHSFSYVNERTRQMQRFVSLLGCQATHVFLSQRMANQFAEHYGQDNFKTLVASNAALVPLRENSEEPPPHPAAFANQATITIGLLSNLMKAKGTLDFIEIVEQARTNGITVRAIMAGPIWDDETRNAIRRASNLGADIFEWRGPVYDRDKDNFFQDIDVFVFPTRYPIEAEPTVIYEAMSWGIPCISRQTGCIDEQIGKGGLCVSKQADFTEAALSYLMDMLANPDRMAEQQQLAKSQFQKMHSKALAQQQRLVDIVAGYVDAEGNTEHESSSFSTASANLDASASGARLRAPSRKL